MADKKQYKCFECGRIYDDEQAALKCHNAPIQLIIRKSGMKKPRFLGN
jgi:DNA-directed RNA polymerase subunit RPC12/RpoP